MNSVQFKEKEIILTINGDPISYLQKNVTSIPVGVEFIKYKGLVYLRDL